MRGCQTERAINQIQEIRMKRNVLIFTTLAIVIVAAVVFFNIDNTKALAVNEVGADPAAYSGTITVTGIMGGVSNQDPSIFGVMDVKELQCKTANCKKLYIPVRYDGNQPALGDEIRMTGSFVNSGQGYLFVAQKLKVVRNHTLGG